MRRESSNRVPLVALASVLLLGLSSCANLDLGDWWRADSPLPQLAGIALLVLIGVWIWG